MANQFQPQLSQPQNIATPVASGGSPVVAGLSVLANIGGDVLRTLSADKVDKRFNEGLGIIVKGVGKTAAGVKQGKKPAASLSAKLIDAQSQLTAAGFTPKEQIALFSATGHRLPSLEAAQAEANAQETAQKQQKALMDSEVHAAGPSFVLDKSGRTAADPKFDGYDTATSFRAVVSAGNAVEAAKQLAQTNAAALNNEAFDATDKHSVVSLVHSRLLPLTQKLQDLANSGKTGPEFKKEFLDTQGLAQGTYQQIEQIAGEIGANIGDKKELDLYTNRVKSLLKGYASVVFSSSSDRSAISQASDAVKFRTAVTKIGIAEASPVFERIMALSPEMQKALLASPVFNAMLTSGASPKIRRALESVLNFVVDPKGGIPNGTTVVGSAQLLKSMTDQGESGVNAGVSDNGSGTAIAAKALSALGDTRALGQLTPDNVTEIVSKLLSTKGLADMVNKMSPTDAASAVSNVGAVLSTASGNVAQQLKAGNITASTFKLKTDPVTKQFTAEFSPTRAAPGDIAIVSVFRFGSEVADNTTVQDAVEKLNKIVDVKMQFRKFDRAAKSLSESDARLLYQNQTRAEVGLPIETPSQTGKDTPIVDKTGGKAQAPAVPHIAPTETFDNSVTMAPDKAKGISITPKQSFDGVTFPVDSFGNPIDTTRPIVHNSDGSFSTEVTATFEGSELGLTGKQAKLGINIPTIVSGVKLSDTNAIRLFKEGLNPAVGVFDTVDAADKAAVQRSKDIGKLRESDAKTTPKLTIDPSTAFDNSISRDIAEFKKGPKDGAKVAAKAATNGNKTPVTQNTADGRSPDKTVDQLAASAPESIKKAAFSDVVAPRIVKSLSNPLNRDLVLRLATVTDGKARFKNLHNAALEGLSRMGVVFEHDKKADKALAIYKENLLNARKADKLFHQRILEAAMKTQLQSKP